MVPSQGIGHQSDRERFEAQAAGPAHLGVDVRLEGRDKPRTLDELAGQSELDGALLGSTVDVGRWTGHHSPRSILAAASASSGAISGNRSLNVLSPSKPAAVQRSGNRVPHGDRKSLGDVAPSPSLSDGAHPPGLPQGQCPPARNGPEVATIGPVVRVEFERIEALELLGMTLAHLNDAEARIDLSPRVPLLMAIRDKLAFALREGS